MTDAIRGLGEFGLIRKLTEQLKQGDTVVHGIGDDCAVLAVGEKQLLLTCDASLEDVHFKRHWGKPEDIGWKAAVSALSDIAAMGGRATAVLVTLALPEDLPVSYAEGLYRGLADAVESVGATIVGGDTTASRSGIIIDITVIGEVVGRPVLRSGAQPGDVIAVTGAIGERGAGLHALLHDVDASELIRAYLHPSPRIEAGQWFQAQPGVHAMMDVSDGLLPDARHIAQASGVGIDLFSDKLPKNDRLDAYWKSQGEGGSLQRVRSGEEYELLVVLAAAEFDMICEAFSRYTGLLISVIGECTKSHEGIQLDGSIPGATGFEHFCGRD
ncbi:MAG: thiamine-phosphate kinase [Candidatus Hydrogenedentes bacterium]|nr:thiamine-phosphate kinase [Candidatus Hydrogenedentota bacterium]